MTNIGAYLTHGKFNPGQVVMTPGILDLVEKGLEPFVYLLRHIEGDWGDLCQGDKNENEMGLYGSEATRLFSAYETDQGQIWIITEWDRSATTILLPSEY